MKDRWEFEYQARKFGHDSIGGRAFGKFKLDIGVIIMVLENS